MDHLSLEYITLDVFTDSLLSGNPLAVVRVPMDYLSSLSQARKQLIAREFNLSETVFMHEPTENGSQVKIDIFTPTTELPFAGHPTIGSACYFMARSVPPNSAQCAAESNAVRRGKLTTKAGEIPITYDPATRYSCAQIPHNVHIHQSEVVLEDLIRCQPTLALDQPHLSPTFPVVSIVKGVTFVLIELPDIETLARISTTTTSIAYQLDEGWAESFVANYFFVKENRSGNTVTLRTRMIDGISEDPATGSAASALAAFLSITAKIPYADNEYRMVQGVEMGRKSEIVVKSKTNGVGDSLEEVVLSGKAVIVSEGRLRC